MALSSLGLIAGMFLALFRRHWPVLVAGLPAVMFVGMYAIVGVGIDRYAIPLFPFGMAYLVYVLSWIWDLITRRKRESVQSQSDSGMEDAVPSK